MKYGIQIWPRQGVTGCYNYQCAEYPEIDDNGITFNDEKGRRHTYCGVAFHVWEL